MDSTLDKLGALLKKWEVIIVVALFAFFLNPDMDDFDVKLDKEIREIIATEQFNKNNEWTSIFKKTACQLRISDCVEAFRKELTIDSTNLLFARIVQVHFTKIENARDICIGAFENWWCDWKQEP